MSKKVKEKLKYWFDCLYAAMSDITIALIINSIINWYWREYEITHYGRALASNEDTIVGFILLWITYIAVKYYRLYSQENHT